MQRVLSIVCLLAVLTTLASAQTTPLDQARQAIRDRAFDQAVTQLDKTLADAKAAQRDEAAYLKALALYHAKQYDKSLAAADAALKQFADSPWSAKATFLKAQCYMQLRQFTEAEKIFEQQTHQLLSAERKAQIAQVLIDFAEQLCIEPDPAKPDSPKPEYAKAYQLLGKALEMEINRELRDQVMFRRAQVIALAGNFGQSINDYTQYLQQFDPSWGRAPDEIAAVEKRSPAGKHVNDARLGLAISQIKAGQFDAGRRNLEDLLAMLDKQSLMIADVRWQIVRSYRMPDAGNEQLDRAIAATRRFLADYSADPRAVVAAWWIPQSLERSGRAGSAAEAITAYEDFIAARNYQLPAGQAASVALDEFNASPQKLHDDWVMLASYSIGRIRFAQRQYDQAITAWNGYVAQYPNGPQWSAAQNAIISAEYQRGIAQVAEGKYEPARALLEKFIADHPLDSRCPQIQFLFGQMSVQQAKTLEDAKAPAQQIADAYNAAIDRWQKLAEKYPRTNEASLALFRIGELYETKLNQLDRAIETYRRVNFGQWAGEAQQHLALMVAKQLKLTTKRAFLTTEQAQVSLDVRNIEKMTVRQYRLDLEAYFRKTHEVGRIEQLDIALIQPDKTWDVSVAEYAKYKPIHQNIDVPFEGKAAGVYLVNVASEDWEATTLVVRSDIDLIVQSTGKQVLVFVQNMRTGSPAKGADVLVCRDGKVVATGKTGDDGVCVVDAPGSPEARTAVINGNGNGSDDVQVFASLDGSIASYGVDVAGLENSSGLQPRGYLYTDRPAYLPGQGVNFRGIIRDVTEGQYVPPVDQHFTFDVLDPAGRVIWSEELTANRFGSIHSKFVLDDAAPVGGYSLRVQRKGQVGSPVFSGSFEVQQFTLPKIRLSVSAPEDVYFRGQVVKYTIDAQYTFGQPVADRVIRYWLPDGRVLTGRTDAKGQLEVSFDTTGMMPGRMMVFAASIEGENVQTRYAVLLADVGFAISVEPAREVALAGEPVDLKVTTKTPGGKPTSQELTLTVYRREVVMGDPVMGAVPWLGGGDRAEEVKVSEQKLKTDGEGKATVQLKLDAGGSYGLRLTGVDGFGQPVSGETGIEISDDKDAVKLRIFAETTTVQVGAAPVVRVHNRLGKATALVTMSGDSIIEHRVVAVEEGYNDLALKIDHKHYPNFRLTVSVMKTGHGEDAEGAGRGEVYEADVPFDVERRLNVVVKPVQEVYQPGEMGKVELVVTDQLGKPVEAELSLAVVDAALYEMYGDNVPSILGYFQQDARRDDELRTGSTIGFCYESTTQAVNKAIAGEGERLERAANEVKKLREMQQAQQVMNQPAMSARGSGVATFGLNAPAASAPPATAAPGISSGAFISDLAMAEQSAAKEMSLDGQAGGGGFGGGDKDRMGIAARRELPSTGVWVADVVTNGEGKATVEVKLPEKTTQWRITSRGVTVQTLAGQAESKVITRKDFFVDLKLPATLMQGDRLSPIARLHNLTGEGGEAEVTLVVKDATGSKKLAEQKRSVKIEKNADVELTLDPVEIGAMGGLQVELRATMGKMDDALVVDVPVRPWGIAYAAHHGGVSEGDVTTVLELSGKGEQQMTVYVGPGVERSVIEWAMRMYPMPMPVARGGEGARSVIVPPQWGMTAGGELLAMSSALEYARAVRVPEADIAELTDRAMQLVQTLTVTQRSDGGWEGMDAKDPWATSSMSFWALARAKSLGLTVENKTMEQGQKYLLNAFRRVDANDNDAKAMILHALSLVDQADFANINRLHRERNGLSNPALAYAALALANQKRGDIAGELLDVLAQRAQWSGEGKKQVYWKGSDKQPMMGDDVQTTALVGLAMAKVKPGSELLAPAMAWLVDQRGCFDWMPGSARGPAIAALAAYYGSAKPVDSQYKLEVLVNGKPVGTVNVKGAGKAELIKVPGDVIADGKNVVELRKNGVGRFTWAATVERFSSEFVDPESFTFIVRGRQYWHDELTYNGRPIGASSMSPVKHVEIGQRVRVYLDVDMQNRGVYDGYLMITEPIPAGMTLVRDSIRSNASKVEIADDHFTLFYSPRTYINDVQYQLMGYATGEYRVLPTVVRDAVRPERMRVGKVSDVAVLRPSEKSDDPYVMNNSERFAMGRLNFDDGHYGEALKYLGELFKQVPQFNEREQARMLLWIATSDGFYDAQRIVRTFEILRERYPELEIPFDRILVVGKAYRDLGEMERATAVFRATLEVSFANDASISAVLEDEGQFLASIDYCEDLWRVYPDTAATSSAYFALSQSLYRMAPKAEELAKKPVRAIRLPGQAKASEPAKVTKVDLLKQTTALLESFLTMYPDSPQADDAAFSLDNAYLDLTMYDRVVDVSQRFEKLYGESEFASSFQYMQALGYFWQRDYAPAMKSAMVVAEGKSKDKDLATYIVGQIYHAQGESARAIDWYAKVAEQYSDAQESIDYFKRQSISLEEVSVFRPGKEVKLTLKYRNIAQAAIQVYRVDLMKLYLREKNLTNVTGVNLAGIAPLASKTLALGDGKDYVDKEKEFDLAIKDEGAYLLIVRGDDLFTSALVLVSPLEIGVQEEAGSGRVRVNVTDDVKKQYVANVHVKAIGSGNADFSGGETDLRGIYVADGINGKVTVIARDGESRYAFYRGEKWLGQMPNAANAAPAQGIQNSKSQLDYKYNLQNDNSITQDGNIDQFDQFRRNGQKGVQVKQAY